ncbi:MAG: hypothetical protein SVU32_09330 [Candidatus Nanohaloarchaea archaeon]|nr:hypothetical protein [Candidatus Nanohaloarchaea archaeon]
MYAEEEGLSYGLEVLEETYVPWEDVSSLVLSFNEVGVFMKENKSYAVEHVHATREAGLEHLSAWIVCGE